MNKRTKTKKLKVTKDNFFEVSYALATALPPKERDDYNKILEDIKLDVKRHNDLINILHTSIIKNFSA